MNALQVYPLINGCHIFLLCTGILPEEKKEDDNEEPIPPEAVLEISRGIYSNLREKQNVPPICIVATKADLAGCLGEIFWPEGRYPCRQRKDPERIPFGRSELDHFPGKGAGWLFDQRRFQSGRKSLPGGF